MNFCLLKLHGTEWEDMHWIGMEMICKESVVCKVLIQNLLGESEENTSTLHLGYLTFGLGVEPCSYMTLKHGICCRGLVCMKLHLHSPTSHLCESVSVFLSVCLSCDCVFIRYSELQQTLSVYLVFHMSSCVCLSTHLILWQRCNIFFVMSLRFFPYCAKLVFGIPWLQKSGSMMHHTGCLHLTPLQIMLSCFKIGTL
jgi:hypothetical protein